MKQLTYTLLFLLAGLTGIAQTNQPLPAGSVPLSNILYLAPDSTVWTGDEFNGLFVKVAKWNSVDSLFKLGYTKAQVDSAITAQIADIPSPTLQSTTDSGNKTNNVIQVTGVSNLDANTESLMLGLDNDNHVASIYYLDGSGDLSASLNLTSGEAAFTGDGIQIPVAVGLPTASNHAATKGYVDGIPGFGLSYNATTGKFDWGTELAPGIHGVIIPDNEALFMGKMGGFMSNLGAITTASSPNGGIGYTAPVTGAVQHGFTFYNAPSGGYTGTTPPVLFTDNLNIGGLHYGSDYSVNFTERSIPDVGWVNSQITSATNLQAVTDNGATTTNGIQALSYSTSSGSVLDANLSTDAVFATGIVQAGSIQTSGLVNGINVTDEPTDANDAATVGWVNSFGLGLEGTNIGDIADFDVKMPSQFIRTTSGANTPFAQLGVGLNVLYGGNRQSQLWFNGTNSNQSIQYRTYHNGNAWTDVRTLWDNNNLPNPWNNSIVGGGWNQPEAAGIFRTISSTTDAPSGIGGALYGAFFASATAGYGTYTGGRNNRYFFRSLENSVHGPWFEVVTSGSNQTIEGNKNWTGLHTFTSASATGMAIVRTGTDNNNSIRFSTDSHDRYFGIHQGSFLFSPTGNMSGATWVEISLTGMDISTGGVNANGPYTNTSDITLKNPAEYDYSSAANIEARPFTWKDGRDSLIRVRYFAQEVREHLPNAVLENPETGILSVDESQVLIAKVALLEKENDELRALIESLTTRVEALENKQ